jgi:hypothetical protein
MGTARMTVFSYCRRLFKALLPLLALALLVLTICAVLPNVFLETFPWSDGPRHEGGSQGGDEARQTISTRSSASRGGIQSF